MEFRYWDAELFMSPLGRALRRALRLYVLNLVYTVLFHVSENFVLVGQSLLERRKFTY